MTTNLIIALVVISFITILFFSIYYSDKQIIIRTLRKLPNKPYSGLKTNTFTKVTGKALAIENPLIAPYSNRPCVFYKIQIQQNKKSGKNNYWKTIVNEEKVQSFLLERNSDYVLVEPKENPKNYKSYLVIDKKTTSGTFNKPTPAFLKVLEKYNIKNEGYFGQNKSLRYTEAVIEIGEEITVAGIAKWKKISTPIAGYSYSKIAALENSNQQKIIITDLPNLNTKR